MAKATPLDVLSLAGEPGMKVRALDVDVFSDALREAYPRVAFYMMDMAQTAEKRFHHARDLMYVVRRGGLVVLDAWEQSLPDSIVV